MNNKVMIALAVVGLGTALCGADAPPERPVPLVDTAAVVEMFDGAPRDYIGHTAALDDVSLYARVSGILTEVKFQAGSMVKQGDLLMTIEDTTYKAKVMQAEAEVQQYKAEVSFTSKNLERHQDLEKKKAVAQLALEEAVRAHEQAKAKLLHAEATLLDAANQLSYTKIYAPISGRIGKGSYSPGNYVTTSSSPLARIVRITPMRILFSVSERDYLTLFQQRNRETTGVNLSVLLADGTELGEHGEIEIVDNKVDPETGTVTIWGRFPNKAERLLPGGYVHVRMQDGKQKKAPAVPVSAIMTESQGNYVFVVNDKLVAERRAVEIGPEVSNFQIIRSGLKVGEKVVVDGNLKVMPGFPVRLKDGK